MRQVGVVEHALQDEESTCGDWRGGGPAPLNAFNAPSVEINFGGRGVQQLDESGVGVVVGRVVIHFGEDHVGGKLTRHKLVCRAGCRLGGNPRSGVVGVAQQIDALQRLPSAIGELWPRWPILVGDLVANLFQRVDQAQAIRLIR